jgi:hypothetical protein
VQRKRSRRKTYKPYEKRVDLEAYQRLMRFLRWMTPQLSPEDALRMLPEADDWTVQQLKENARQLADDLARPNSMSLEALIPYIVTGIWGWPSNKRYTYILSDEQGTTSFVLPTLPPGRRPTAEPVLLVRRFPTIEGLCQLASDVQEVLRYLAAGDTSHPFELIGTAIEDRIVRRFARSTKWREADQFLFRDAIRGHDFRAYCFWLLAKLLAEGHAWRVTSCIHCGGFFLKTRRDPPQRPSRFCSELCRRGWHNPKRPKKGVQP